MRRVSCGDAPDFRFLSHTGETMLRGNLMKRSRNRLSQDGFTLIEIMIVLAIVGLLFSFVGVNIVNKFRESKAQAAKIQIANLEQGLLSYYTKHGKYPTTAEGLQALADDGHLQKKTVPKDPWNQPYIYACEDKQSYKISSAGPDEAPNTEDDIRSAE